MNGEPLVSIFCPSFNHAAFVGETLESVLAQSYSNWELVIVDDASTDGTREIVSAFAAAHGDRVKCRIGGKNRGTAARWNEMLGTIRGRLLMAVGSDDLLPPEGVEKRVRFMTENDDVDFLLTDFGVLAGSRLYSGIEKLDVVPQFERFYRPGVFDRLYEELLGGNFIHPGAACYRVGAIGKENLRLDPRTPNLHDYDQMLAMARDHRIAYLDEPTYVYRWHGKNTSSGENPEKDDEAVTAEMNYILAKQLLRDRSPARRIFALDSMYDCMYGLLKRGAEGAIRVAEDRIGGGDSEGAREILRRLLKHDPGNLDALNDLSVIAAGEGNLAEAARLIETVLSIDPKNEVASDNLARMADAAR